LELGFAEFLWQLLFKRILAMIDQDVLEGKWHTIRGILKTKWAKLTEDDLLGIDGGIDQLIGRIQHRTGESREAIEHFLDQAATQANETLDDLHQAAHETVRQVADQVRHQYGQAERAIHDRPGQAVLVAFGLGIVTGLGAAVLLTSHRREQTKAHGSLRHSSEQLGRQLSDAILHALPQSMGGRR
jgi:uncharacterized protein YjbJ (UPF0337 family)